MTIEQIITELEAEHKDWIRLANDEFNSDYERQYSCGVARGIMKALNFIKYLKQKAED